MTRLWRQAPHKRPLQRRSSPEGGPVPNGKGVPGQRGQGATPHKMAEVVIASGWSAACGFWAVAGVVVLTVEVADKQRSINE